MTRLAYVNHRYIPHSQAMLSIDDRGTQFGDAVYEVFSILNGRTIDMQAHTNRLHRSLQALDIPIPMSDKALHIICRQLVHRNRLKNGMVYIQISRGTMNRKHIYPTAVCLRPNVLITTHWLHLKSSSEHLTPIKIQSFEDTRWAGVATKTVMLLPNCMAKTKARNAGYEEILFVKNGIVTECGSSNFFYFDKDGVLHTPPAGDILLGCTRHGLMACAKKLQIPVRETHFSLADAKRAKYAFISSASQFLCPVSHIDTTVIETGVPKVLRRLFDLYINLYIDT